MNICVLSRNLLLNREFKKNIFTLIRKDFSSFENKISNVKVVIEDINGPIKGGPDKECRIQFKLIPKGHILVRQNAKTISEALNLASEKIWTRLRKEIELAKF